MRALNAFLLALLALFAGALVCQAQQTQQAALPAEMLTLEQAISLALQNNRSVQDARLETEKADDRLAAYRTNRLPTLKTYSLFSQPLTTFDFTFKKGELGTFPATGPIPAEDTTISSGRKPTVLIIGSVTQPLTQLRRLNLKIKSLEADREVSAARLRDKQQAVVKDVKQAYYSMLQTQSAFESAEQMIKLYHELDRITGEYVAQQVALVPDLLQVRTRLAKADYELLVLQNQLATQKEQFNNLLGRPVLIEFSISHALEDAQFVMRETDLIAARERALAQRPEVAEARSRVKQAQYERRAKKAEYLPDVSLSLNYVSPLNFSSFLPKQVMNAGILVEWDVFDWGRKRHELASKTRDIEQANNSLREIENHVVIEVNSRYRKLQETCQQLRVARLSQDAEKANVQVVTYKYRFESSLFKDVLQAQASLADANYQYQKALLSFWTAKADFEKAIGEDK